MFDGPFNGEAQGPFGQMANDDFQCSNVDLRFMFGIHGVEVRWSMFSPEHLNNDTEELADGGHGRALEVIFSMLAQQSTLIRF